MSGTDLRPLGLTPQQEEVRRGYHLGIEYTTFLANYATFKTNKNQELIVARALKVEGSQLLEKLRKEQILSSRELKELTDPIDNLQRYINSRSEHHTILDFQTSPSIRRDGPKIKDSTEEIRPNPYRR